MKTRLITLLSILTVISIAAPQVSALDIQVSKNGQIDFQQGLVLGRNDDRGRDEMENKREIPEVAPKSKTITVKDKQLTVKKGSDSLEIELRGKDKKDDDFDKVERMKADDIKLNFPAELTSNQAEAAQEKRAQGMGVQDQTREEYLQRIQVERQTRFQEMVEVKNQGEDKQNSLTLKSRNTTAALENGAEFKLDPETNEVVIVTPAGEEHVLNHLPDQAIARMSEAGFFDETTDDETEIEVQTNEVGDLYYSKKNTIKKKLFGLFPRIIDSEIILDDATGEVVEIENTSDSIFEKFFNAVSF